MNKILILCYGYDEGKSNNANAICLHEVVDSLSKEKEVYIITSTTREKVYKRIKGNIKTYYIPIKNNENGKLKFSNWEKEVIKFIHDNIEVKIISKLLTISLPFNIQKIGYKIKKEYPHLQWIIYELDPYAYNFLLRYPKILFMYRYVQEKTAFIRADYIMLTHELFEQYSNNLFSRYKHKLKNIGIPLMKIYDQKNTKKKSPKDTCNFYYIGSFHNRIREPKYMLEVLGKVANSIDEFQMHIYGPKIDSISSQYKEQLGDKLYLHGRVSKEKVLIAISEADVLVNIGNSINNQLPSKILEYIGTGKPIINFYCIPDDTSNKYLKNYPNALLIKQDDNDIEGNKKRIIEFINNNKDVRVEKNEIMKIFKDDTSEAVKEKLLEILV